jgi:osmotically-inducible protein OsmY
MTRAGDLYFIIRDRFDFEPSLEASNIIVSVKDSGVVILTGMVRSYAEKLIAEKVLQKILGVNGIIDELEVKLADEYIRSDAVILSYARNALKANLLVPYKKIKCIVKDGRLALTGKVDQYYQKMHARKAVENIIGIVDLIDNIVVISKSGAFNIKDQITKEFERNSRIDVNNIAVDVEGGSVTLKGIVRSFDENKEARISAWSVPGVVNVIDQMMISWRR